MTRLLALLIGGSASLVLLSQGAWAASEQRAPLDLKKPQMQARNQISPSKVAPVRNPKQPADQKQSQTQKHRHQVAVQLNSNDETAMNAALNNVSNIEKYYRELGEKVEVEVVAFGPGLNMLREDTSPVKERIKTMAAIMPNLVFSACGNTMENMTRIEAKNIPIIPEAKVVKSGVVRLLELQEQGWSYVRP